MANLLPDCMMPDGAEPCVGYQQAAEDRRQQIMSRDKEIAALKSQLASTISEHEIVTTAMLMRIHGLEKQLADAIAALSPLDAVVQALGIADTEDVPAEVVAKLINDWETMNVHKQALEGALREYDRLSLVISSAVHFACPDNHDAIEAAIKSGRAALAAGGEQ